MTKQELVKLAEQKKAWKGIRCSTNRLDESDNTYIYCSQYYDGTINEVWYRDGKEVFEEWLFTNGYSLFNEEITTYDYKAAWNEKDVTKECVLRDY